MSKILGHKPHCSPFFHSYLQHASRNLADAPWRAKPATDKQKALLRRTLGAQSSSAAGGGAAEAGGCSGGDSSVEGGGSHGGNTAEGGTEGLDLSRLSCGEASELISVQKLAQWHQQGLIRFPRMWAG